VHRLVHASLVGAECATTLQDERDAIAAIRSPAFEQSVVRLRGQSWAGANIIHEGKSAEWRDLISKMDMTGR
jgi:hypothetical protein